MWPDSNNFVYDLKCIIRYSSLKNIEPKNPAAVHFALDSVGNHSLHYIYTALLRVDGLHFYEVTGIGLLDGQPVDLYSSKDQTWTPKTPWMKSNMPSEYWQRGNLRMKKLNHIVLEIMQDNCVYNESGELI